MLRKSAVQNGRTARLTSVQPLSVGDALSLWLTMSFPYDSMSSSSLSLVLTVSFRDVRTR